MKNTGKPAFPLNTPRWHEELNQQGWLGGDFTTGMTLRDYFAAKAMQAILSDDPDYHQKYRFIDLSDFSYQCADAMLKAREA